MYADDAARNPFNLAAAVFHAIFCFEFLYWNRVHLSSLSLLLIVDVTFARKSHPRQQFCGHGRLGTLIESCSGLDAYVALYGCSRRGRQAWHARRTRRSQGTWPGAWYVLRARPHRSPLLQQWAWQRRWRPFGLSRTRTAGQAGPRDHRCKYGGSFLAWEKGARRRPLNVSP